MNEIRKNTEKEVKVVSGYCKMPKLIKGFYISFICIFAIVAICLFVASTDNSAKRSGANVSFITFGMVFLIFLAVLIIFFVLQYKAISKSHVIVSNKRVYGLCARFLYTKQFSYRLDQIDNVEFHNFLGLNAISINFNQGYQNNTPMRYGVNTAMRTANCFVFNYLVNGSAVYNKLNELLTSVKNERDLKTDIEMKKIEVEEKKAEALMNAFVNKAPAVATPTEEKKLNYIEELKELKTLLDSNIISEEEFNIKKQELLNKNNQ